MRRALPYLLTLFASGASAQSLTLAGDLPGDLETRIRGQLSDLAWTVTRDREPPGPLVVMLERGDTRVVAWVAPYPDGVVLHLLDRQGRRMLSRAFERPVGEAHPESTLHESVAVSLRSSLRALDAGGTIGVVVPAAEREPVAERDPAPEPAAAPEQKAIPPSRVLRWAALGVGGWLALDGASPVQGGLGAGVVLALGPLRVGAGLQLGIGADLETQDVTLRLARDALVAEVGGALGGARVEAVGVLRIGAGMHRRETTSVEGPLVATERSRLLSPVVGVRLSLRIFLHRYLALRLDLGADGWLSAPVFETDSDRVAAPWALQPSAALTFEVRALTRSGRSAPP